MGGRGGGSGRSGSGRPASTYGGAQASAASAASREGRTADSVVGAVAGSGNRVGGRAETAAGNAQYSRITGNVSASTLNQYAVSGSSPRNTSRSLEQEYRSRGYSISRSNATNFTATSRNGSYAEVHTGSTSRYGDRRVSVEITGRGTQAISPSAIPNWAR